MSKHNPPRLSLLERAAQTYGLGTAMHAPPIDLHSGIGGSPMDAFGSSPIAGRTGTIDREELRAAGYILPDAAVSAIAEEFRIVKRQLLLTAAEPGKANTRMILVCSAQPGEGKTFCAVNLALSLAGEKDVEVLLIDGDFAKPSVLSALGLENGPGLMDAIADPAIDPEGCIIHTDLRGLSVLPAGRQSNEATELIASDRTRIVLERLAAPPQRILIFDSPPALAASPASVLALHAGQAVMVVRADRTSEAELRDALALLAGCPNIRLLLNGASFAGGRRRFGSYYGYGE